METAETDHEQTLEFVQRCREEHIAPYPVSFQIVSEHTGPTMYRVRVAVAELTCS